MDPTTLINGFLENYGTAAVIAIAAIIFIETGLFFPILPGDSLLFVAGAFAAQGSLGIDLPLLVLIMVLAAFLGDQNAYWIGRLVGPKLFKEDSRVFKKKYIDKTHEYFEKYGGRTIIIARFVPIVRTFSAVSAGVSRMNYRTFVIYDALGAIAWGGGVTTLGYLLGNIEFVKKNIEVLLVLIVLISVIPMAVEILKARKEAKSSSVPMSTIEAVARHEAQSAGEGATLPATPYLGRDAAPGPSAGGGTGHRDVAEPGLPPRHVRGE
jgi:membrane-associated protein